MIAKRLSRLYERRLRSYVYWKVRLDPSYPAVVEQLRGREHEPLLDLGCGIGILPLFLREHGFTGPITGVDFDDRKIAVARQVAPAVRFICADARGPLPPAHNVVMLDVLQYFDTESQNRILANIAGAVPPGGVAVMRQGVRDRSWRFRMTRTADAFARVIRWMRMERLNFPTREQIVEAFAGFEAEVTPLWGRTPYNNYLFVFTRN